MISPFSRITGNYRVCWPHYRKLPLPVKKICYRYVNCPHLCCNFRRRFFVSLAFNVSWFLIECARQILKHNKKSADSWRDWAKFRHIMSTNSRFGVRNLVGSSHYCHLGEFVVLWNCWEFSMSPIFMKLSECGNWILALKIPTFSECGNFYNINPIPTIQNPVT
jgi:hypothetical protein